MWIHACGLIHSIFVTGPRSVTGALASNSAEKAWWATSGTLAVSSDGRQAAENPDALWHVTTSDAAEHPPGAAAPPDGRRLRGTAAGNVIEDQRRIDVAQHQVVADDAVFELLRKLRQHGEQRRRHRRHLRRGREAQVNRRRLRPRRSSSSMSREYRLQVVAANRVLDAPLDDRGRGAATKKLPGLAPWPARWMAAASASLAR